MRNMNNISELVKYAFVTLLGTLCLAGCGQDEKIGLNATDSVAPGLPTNIEVENINGGAIIRYTPPKDDDLLCVVASYMINGVERTTKASPYVDSLIVEGFGKVGDYNIFLKSVDKSQNESEPKTVSISPLTPPVEYIYESLKITDSFGGVSLTWKLKELPTRLPGDCEAMGGLPIRNIWQGNNNTDCFHSVTNSDNPAPGRCITFDMGQVAKVSRFKMWQRRGDANVWTYTHNNLKKYVIYGCTELTDEMYNSGVEKDGIMYPTFEGWTKIMDVECYKPSGQDNPNITLSLIHISEPTRP